MKQKQKKRIRWGGVTFAKLGEEEMFPTHVEIQKATTWWASCKSSWTSVLGEQVATLGGQEKKRRVGILVQNFT